MKYHCYLLTDKAVLVTYYDNGYALISNNSPIYVCKMLFRSVRF